MDNLNHVPAILENIIKQKYGLRINYIKINFVLKQRVLAISEPKKWHRKKWMRYERGHSKSLWHVDWHEIKDPRVYG